MGLSEENMLNDQFQSPSLGEADSSGAAVKVQVVFVSLLYFSPSINLPPEQKIQ
ncbi:MAG: hypothetical protein U0930_09040 [Pirellulales bacterium]